MLTNYYIRSKNFYFLKICKGGKMFDILVFEQVVTKKEDKTIKRYNLLDSEEYKKGHKKVLEEDINTFEETDRFLANVNISYIDFSLKELNCSLDDIDTQKFNGFFEAVVVCITEKGTYKNMYVLKKNKFGLFKHIKVKSNCLISEKGVLL